MHPFSLYVGDSILVVGIRGLDALVHVLHLAVDLSDLARAFEHLLVDALGQLRFVDLVADIVLKARPEVHGDRAQLGSSATTYSVRSER